MTFTTELPWPVIVVCLYAWMALNVWVFYGMFLLFKDGHLCCDEVADRSRDGRMFRDILLWPTAFNWLELPGLLIAAFVYPIVITVRRVRLAKFRRYRTPC